MHQTDELQQQTLKTLAGSPFNKIRFCVFPKDYTYNKNEPKRFAFQKKADGTFDFDRPDPDFWHHFEGRILALQKLGIEADVILWHPYDRWGWVQAGVVEDLRGLRSFTVMGWVKPESLQVGMGGNRIVFCLDRDHSGIDLVCHSDGRLRLSVNQWPDRVKNDSSPGKLVVGRWTRFTVTYDATKAADNVHWYFSKPQGAPGPAPITLDRETTYNVGPMAVDIGPLAIGNFNRTMKGYGMDRQFRGELQGLQIFGSRVSGRGALSLDEIQKQ